MKYYFLLLISIVLLYVGCAVRQAPKPAAPPPKVYPEEVNFLRTMAIGDTLFIFLKQSSWTELAHSGAKNFYTFYARNEIVKLDQKFYRLKRTYAHTAKNRFEEFELDTMKYRLRELQNLTIAFQYYCKPMPYEPNDFEIETCSWEEDFSTQDNIYFEDFIKTEFTDANLQGWRFKNPTYLELDNWRKKDFDWPIAKTETLVFWKDTCKISYSQDSPTLFGRVFDY